MVATTYRILTQQREYSVLYDGTGAELPPKHSPARVLLSSEQPHNSRDKSRPASQAHTHNRDQGGRAEHSSEERPVQCIGWQLRRGYVLISGYMLPFYLRQCQSLSPPRPSSPPLGSSQPFHFAALASCGAKPAVSATITVTKTNKQSRLTRLPPSPKDVEKYSSKNHPVPF